MGCMELFKNLTTFVGVSTVTNLTPQHLKDLYKTHSWGVEVTLYKCHL